MFRQTPLQNVCAYLDLLQRERGRCRRDDEAATALAYLPQETLVFPYESLLQMEAVARNVEMDDGRDYYVFANVPEDTVDRDLETINIGRVLYFPKSKTLISRMPRRPHEVAAGWLNDALHDSVAAMGMSWRTHLISLGATTVEHKEPDLSLQPVNLPPDRSSDWPSLVVEVGSSASPSSLDNNAKQWLTKSNGDVRVVITIEVTRTKLIVKRWAKTRRTGASVLQTVSVTERGQQASQVTGGPLRIPFEDIFLRAPNSHQHDFEYGADDLKQWANRVWSQF